MKFEINYEAAVEIYDFIATHLAVENNLPYVENFMLELEDKFDLPED